MHQYYKVATGISWDFYNIAYSLSKSLKCRTKQKRNSKGIKSRVFMRYYGDFKGKIIYIQNYSLIPNIKGKNKTTKMFFPRHLQLHNNRKNKNS